MLTAISTIDGLILAWLAFQPAASALALAILGAVGLGGFAVAFIRSVRI